MPSLVWADGAPPVAQGYNVPGACGLGACFAGVGGPSQVLGHGTIAATTSSALMSGLTLGPNSAPWPLVPGMVYVMNSGVSAGIAYVAPLGGTCISGTGIPISPGAAYGFFRPSTNMTVCAASSATVSAQW